jgi:hypothetical protein
MHRRSFLAAAAGALVATQRPAIAAEPKAKLTAKASVFVDPSNGQLGAAISVRDSSGVLEALSPTALAGTQLEVKNAAPSSSRAVVLSNLPTVSTQGVPGSIGNPGSCEAQSFGYCLGAYTAARNPDGSIKWSAAEAANQPSAAWLYQWEHAVVENDARVCPNGSGAKPYADKLVATGAPSTAAFPYNPNDATTAGKICKYIKGLSVTTAPPGSSRFLVGSYKVYGNVLHRKAAYLSQFKELIRHGHAIAFSGLVPKQYCIEKPPLTNDAFTAPAGFIPKSGHGQVIVGFNDAKGPNGAFLVQNSFGPGWNPGVASDRGHNGRIWYDYDAWFAGQGYALIMFSNGPIAAGGTPLHTAGSGPRFVVASATPHADANGKHHLVLVTQASEAVTITGLTVTPRTGRRVTMKLNEAMRLGYQYVTRPRAFPPGPCKVAYTVKTRAGDTLAYTGSVNVTPPKA